MTCVTCPRRSGTRSDNHAEERADGGEPVVARSHRAAAVAFEVVEKRQHRVGVQRCKWQRRRFGAGLPLHEPQQQAEGVTVAGDGLRAGALVGEQVLGKERLQVRADEAACLGRRPHGAPPTTPSGVKREPAARSRSGVAVRYQ